jgi:hypothetical protein
MGDHGRPVELGLHGVEVTPHDLAGENQCVAQANDFHRNGLWRSSAGREQHDYGGSLSEVTAASQHPQQSVKEQVSDGNCRHHTGKLGEQAVADGVADFAIFTEPK